MIVAATKTDAAICSNILHQWIWATTWFPNHAPESASEQSMKERIENGTVLLAKSGKETVGFVAFANGYLDCLYMIPAMQSHGVGKDLLDKAKAANPDGLALWVLAQNERAVRFYFREGFVETARGDGSDNEENLPDIRMEWNKMEAAHG